MAAKVFISYRRDDSAGHAGRIHDRLERELGRHLLFMDVDTIPLGANFLEILREEVAKCGVLLAVIGPGWLDARGQDGRRRLESADDFVRVEIAAALERNIPVIPILVDGARLPPSDQLPADLQELPLRNGLEVRHASFHKDMSTLVRELNRRSAEADAPPAWLRPKGDRPIADGKGRPPPGTQAERDVSLPPAWLRPKEDWPIADMKGRLPTGGEGARGNAEPKRRAGEEAQRNATADEARPAEDGRVRRQAAAKQRADEPVQGRKADVEARRQAADDTDGERPIAQLIPKPGTLGHGRSGVARLSRDADASAEVTRGERDPRSSWLPYLSQAPGLAAGLVGLVAISFGIPIHEFTLGTTLILSGTIALAGGLVAIGLATGWSMVWWVLGGAQSGAGLVAILYGAPIHEFTFGRMLMMTGTVGLAGGLAAIGVAASRRMVWWALGIAESAVGLIALAFGVPINEFALGSTLILAGTIAVAGGLVAIGHAANRTVVWWALGVGGSAAGLIALALGVPTHEFALGPMLIMAGTIALAGGLVAIGLAANRSIVWWLLAVGESATGLIALGFGVPIKEFSLGTTLILAGTIPLTGGLVTLGHAANRSIVTAGRSLDALRR